MSHIGDERFLGTWDIEVCREKISPRRCEQTVRGASPGLYILYARWLHACNSDEVRKTSRRRFLRKS